MKGLHNLICCMIDLFKQELLYFNNMKKNFKRNIYTKQDSGAVFFFALLAPQVVGSILYFLILFCSVITQTNHTENPISSILLTLSTQLSFFLVFVFYNKFFRINHKKASKINFKVGFFAYLLPILMGIVTLFGFQNLISYFDLFLQKIGISQTPLPLPLDTVGWLVVNLFVLALIPAICEELIFRGVVYNGFLQYGKVKAIIFSALLFALVHGNIEQTLYPILFGLVLALIVSKTKSVIPAIVVHFVNNFVVLFINYLFNIGVLFSSSDLIFEWNEFLISIGYALLSTVAILLMVKLIKVKNKQVDEEKTNDFEKNWDSITRNNDVQALEKASGQKNVFLWTAVALGSLFWIFSLMM